MSKYPIACFLLVLTFAGGEARGSMIAFWPGDGNTNEAVAGRNGTLVNGATFGSGIVGSAFSLDGADDYVSVADDNVWAFGSGDFTIALWANFDRVKAQDFRQLPNVFIGHSPGAGNQNKWVFYYDDDGYLMFLNGPNNVDNVNFLRSPTTFSPTLGAWHHFAVTRSSSNTYTFYADGLSLGTVNSTVLTPNATGNLTIGQAEGLGYFDGRLDEIRIYNNALSSSEVAQLSVPEPASLVLWATLGGTFGLIAVRRRRQVS